MYYEWAVEELKGLPEMLEAVLRLDASLVASISSGDEFLSFPTSSSLPERLIEQLRYATVRANALREQVRQLLIEMGQRLNCTVPHDTLSTKNFQYGRSVSVFLEFKRLDTIRYMDHLLKLLRIAKGIGASFEIAAVDIHSNLETNCNLEQEGEDSVDHSTNNHNEGIIFSRPSDDLDDDLLDKAEALKSSSEQESDRLRDLATDLLNVRESLKSASFGRQVATDSSEGQ